ncbi:hypothetical protein B6S12_09650 [Helicobacter valdiviensis]|uniref:Filamentous haemagglutinin FhaB/tRNA nuclease CdiA-like TPS domain-containing protein n=1 Tax=Helicobacter valdiviensis TaxID=1458358 RepID=A0A2W6MS20_9HELI|nr:hypothetical protein [Helicobacter valdiviensis]PZT47327.1 hypothetical protein B6S12_09650 [Helicobacter valdiviensis]
MSGYRIKKQISISIVASIFLAQQSLYALPSGGKFTHGSSGTITSGKGSMDITGIKGTGGGNNYVINWGGGFGINKGEDVNFHNKTKGNGGGTFLNIDLKGKTSQINGDLNANGNNIFIINPAGMTIGKDGAINGANQFGFSSMALNASQITAFANNSDESKNYNFFYPSNFKQNKGDLVNLGTIQANEIKLVGNKVELGKIENNGNNKTNVSIDGNYVYVNMGKIKNPLMSKTIKVEANARIRGYQEDTMKNFHDGGKGYTFFNDSNLISTQGNDWRKSLTLENTTEWNFFAEAWNNPDKYNLQEVGDDVTVRLLNDIDFKWQKADTVGINNQAFKGIFDGGGYKLENVTLTSQIGSGGTYTGLFGIVEGGTIANLILSGVAFSGEVQTGGSIAAVMKGGTIDNVHVDGKNGSISASTANDKNSALGGMVGSIEGNSKVVIKNSSVKNFNSISMTSNASSGNPALGVGGFVGAISNGEVTFENILLDSIGNIEANDVSENKNSGLGKEVGAGGFVGKVLAGGSGNLVFKDIDIKNLGNVNVTTNEELTMFTGGAGGFVGVLNSGASFQNIYIDINGGIKAEKTQDDARVSSSAMMAGGLIGNISNAITIKDLSGIKIDLDKAASIQAINKRSEKTNLKRYAGAGGLIGGSFSMGNSSLLDVAIQSASNNQILIQGDEESAIQARIDGVFEGFDMVGKNTISGLIKNNPNFALSKVDNFNGFNGYYKESKIDNGITPPPTQIKLDDSDYAGVEESIKDIFDEFKNSGYELDLNTNDGVITFYYKGDKNTKIEISLSDLEGKNFVDFVEALATKAKAEYEKYVDIPEDKITAEEKQKLEQFNSLYQTLDFISEVASNGNVGDKDNVDNTRPDYENTIHYSLKNSSSNYKNGGKALGEYTAKLASLLSYVDGMQEDLKNNKELQEEFIKNWGGNSLEEAYKNYVSFYEAFNKKYGALEDAYKAIENEYLSVTERLRQAYKNYQENQTGANEAELIFAAEAYNSFMKANGDTILALEEPAYKSGANKINNTHTFLKNKLGASYASIENGLNGIDFSGNGKDGKYDSADNGYFANSSGSLTIFADFATKDSKGTRATLTLPDTSDLDGINPPTPSLPDTDLIEDERGSVLVLKEEDEEKDVIEQEEIEYTDGQEGGSLCIVSDGFTTHNPCSAGRI